MIRQRKFLFSILLFLATIIPAPSEVFRTQKTIVIAASDAGESKTAGINSCVCVTLPSDMTFVQGIEINAKIPKALSNYRNTVIYSIYNDIAPLPSEKETDYSGKELYTGMYPAQLSWSIIVPLVKGNKLKASPYADKTLIPNSARGFVFLRNQLAMKGVPQTVLDAEFEFSAKIIYSDMGALKINASQEIGEYSILIDEKAAVLDKNGLVFLKPGKHNVSVVSEKFRNEVRTVVIEQAKITEVAFNLTSVQPTFKANMPQGTKIFVDGEEVSDISALKLESGSHIFKFTLGGYEVTKNIDIQNGKNYNISVNFDANISVEE